MSGSAPFKILSRKYAARRYSAGMFSSRNPTVRITGARAASAASRETYPVRALVRRWLSLTLIADDRAAAGMPKRKSWRLAPRRAAHRDKRKTVLSPFARQNALPRATRQSRRRSCHTRTEARTQGFLPPWLERWGSG